jgi:hypothetical protein
MPKHPGGRPKGSGKKERKIPKTPEEFAEYLGSIGVPGVQVAERLGVHYDTFHDESSLFQAYKRGLERLCDHLRTLQAKTAEKSFVMQIWLGKQLLQQRDKQELSGPDGAPIQSVVTVEFVQAGKKPSK